MSEDLWRLPASVLRGHIAAKKVSPVELTEAVLARAAKLQPVLNCFITIAADQARAAARQAEDAVMQGKPLGLLHGIPFAAKDLVNTAGVRTTFGSLHHDENVPREDAVCAARVKSSGAILLNVGTGAQVQSISGPGQARIIITSGPHKDQIFFVSYATLQEPGK